MTQRFGPSSLDVRAPNQATKPKLKVKKQVAALPVRFDAEGKLCVLLITSRETKRLIVPKGWSMRGVKDHRAAALEAKQEAGVVGRVHRKPIGSYTYWKRREKGFDFCKVAVFVLDVERHLTEWREQGEREQLWLLLDDAIERVEEPGLIPSLQELPNFMTNRRGKRKRMTVLAPVTA